MNKLKISIIFLFMYCFVILAQSKNSKLSEADIALIDAAYSGFLETVKTSIAKGANVNILDDYKGTSLMASCMRNRSLSVVRYLIENGADVNIKTTNGTTALMLAAYDGNLELIKFLVESGADVNAKKNNGNTILMTGISWFSNPLGNDRWVQIGISQFQQDRYNQVNASDERNQMEIVKYLIEKTLDINNQDSEGTTALIMASKYGNLELAKLLIKKGAEINAKTKDGNTALKEAADTRGHLELVKFLLENKADINAKTVDGTTALMTAVRNNNLEVVRFLLENKADVNAKTKDGNTALKYASKYPEIVKLFHANQEKTSNISETQHKIYSMSNDEKVFLESIKAELAKKIDINKIGENLETRLMAASKKGYLDTVKFLIEKGANINISAQYGGTALTKIADRPLFPNQIEIIKLLLENNADINYRISRGKTTLILASQYGNLELVKLLVEKGADLNLKDEINNAQMGGYTALIMAAQKNHLEIVKFLVENGADINLKDNAGYTALMKARAYNQNNYNLNNIIGYLQSKGAE